MSDYYEVCNVTYKNNIQIGTATITFTGKGLYYGNKTMTFQITPQKVSQVSVKRSSSTMAKISWSKVSNCSGYEVVYSTNKSFSKDVKRVDVSNKYTTKTIKKLSRNKKYYFKVRSYKNVGGKKIYSSYSQIMKA